MFTERDYKAMFETNRETGTPEETVAKFVEAVGYGLAQFVAASLVNGSAWDGRISSRSKAWAESVEDALDREATLAATFYNHLHCAHLNQIAEAMAKYEPEIPAEEVEAAVAESVAEEMETAPEETAEEAGEEMHVHISKGNIKMGIVPSVSLVPFLSCPGVCGSTCGGKCYAAKIANLRPNVLKNYAENQALFMLRPEQFFTEVSRAMRGFRFFRWNVAGDILNRRFLDGMIQAARENPHCKSLAFTKQFRTVNGWLEENGGELPENLQILFSGWENLEPVNPYNLPTAWAVDFDVHNLGEWQKLPDGWNVCGGNCFECACAGVGCWNLRHGEAVCFGMH